MSPFLGGAVARQVLHQQWPGANYAHISLDDIDQLRHLIEGSAPDKAAYRCETVGVRQQFAVLIFLVVHRFELHDLEYFFPFAGPGLEKEWLAGICNGQQYNDDNK